MPQVCLYFQLHQPYRLQPFEVFDIGKGVPYFSASKKNTNRQIFKKVAKKSYLPMLQLLWELTQEVPQFTCALSCSGVFLEQAQEFEPKVIALLQKLAATKRVEFLAETYYHSLAFLYSPAEYGEHIKKHSALIKQLFNLTPKVFRNTELIYANWIGEIIAKQGFKGMLTEAVDRYLRGQKRTVVYQSNSTPALPLLLKHAQLSDDIAFRFSDKNWASYPLTVERYLDWVEIYPENEIINLFMDFETFGEHQWRETGIFEFFKAFVHQFVAKPWNHFVNPTSVFSALPQTTSNEVLTDKPQSIFEKIKQAFIKTKQQVAKATPQLSLPVYDVPDLISWADVNRDITAWRDNDLQFDALRKIYALEDRVLATNDQNLIEDWRRLQTSDHFYYMCTKWAADGDVHAYFNPYRDPYEAYRRYSIVLADLQERLL